MKFLIMALDCKHKLSLSTQFIIVAVVVAYCFFLSFLFVVIFEGGDYVGNVEIDL